MNKITHPIEPEELMAYLDGELSAERAAVTAAHLGECDECKGVVEGFRTVSRALKTWGAPPPNSPVPDVIVNALGDQEAGQRSSNAAFHERKLRLRWRKLAWAAGLATIGVLIVFGIATPNLYRSRQALMTMRDRVQLRREAPSNSPAPTARRGDKGQISASLEARNEKRAKREGGGGGGDTDRLNSGPMIIRTAELQLITKEFDKTRAGLESILKKHHGYVGELKVGGATGSGRTLTSTLRVPADQVDATLTELKTLGRVESESQGGQDVTSQYVDLQARLANARNTEKRLTDLLSQRTGKLSDVLEVEQEVGRVRGEIEQMEAESKHLTKQVSFATLNVTIAEDYKAQLEVVPPSTATRLSNAAVEGYRSMADGVVGVMHFALSNGPSVVLWVAVLFLPARFAWKTMRRKVAQ